MLSGVYFFACHYWYCCTIKASCYGCAPAKVAVASPMVPDTPPLSFEWSKATPLLGVGFDEEMQTWLADNRGDNLLEITGRYDDDEVSPSGYENMGLARAAIVRALLLTELPEERIRLKSELIEVIDKSDLSDNDIITTAWKSISDNDSDLIKLDKKVVILFPKNSIKKETNKETDKYLKSVAERVKDSGEIIHLVGHTDNDGDEASNLKLAKKRALRIRRILRQKGVSRDQIKVETKGETEPVATNETENGRYLNRRVVLTLKEN
ncbi:MAG: OmpA family protein [Saprospiraceae bacterium]